MPEKINLFKAKKLMQAKPGVEKYKLPDGTVGWFKHASRPLNNPKKVRAMGIVNRTDRLTEAHAFLPEREVLASQIAKLLIPHLALSAKLAKHGINRGVFIDHAEGEMASEYVDYGTMQIDSKILSLIKPQLADLQTFDYLIGSVDRHVENYMISKIRPKRYAVMAIDNDLSFPAVGVNQLSSPNVPDSKFEGLPNGYTVVVAERIQQMKEASLSTMIKGTLVGAPNLDAVVREAIKRLNELKRDVRLKNRKQAEPKTPSHYTGLFFG